MSIANAIANIKNANIGDIIIFNKNTYKVVRKNNSYVVLRESGKDHLFVIYI